MINRITVTICEHIVTKETSSGTCHAISIDESADAGIVITALEVVEPGFRVVAVAVPFA